ncbi:MAG: hypothetical protein AAF748_11670 [Pseudomonadota bacterium]
MRRDETFHRPPDSAVAHWHEAISASIGFGFAGSFSLDWILDRVEREEWGGLWW